MGSHSDPNLPGGTCSLFLAFYNSPLCFYSGFVERKLLAVTGVAEMSFFWFMKTATLFWMRFVVALHAYDNLSAGKLLAVNGVAEMSFPLMKNATLFTMRFGVAPHAYDNLPAGKLLVVNGVAEMSFPLMKNATFFWMRFGVALHAYNNLPAGICSPSLALRICALALGKLLSHYFGFFFGGALSARGYRSHTLAVLLLRGSCSLFLALRIVICGGEVAPGTL